MKERITIKNFCGIDDVTIDLGKINVFIGPQASGKSVIAKLLYFFKSSPRLFVNESIYENKGSNPSQILTDRFSKIFPSDYLGSDDFMIKYENNDFTSTVSKKNENLITVDSSAIVREKSQVYQKMNSKREDSEDGPLFINYDFFNSLRPDKKYFSYNQFFIPAARSFFASLDDNIYHIMLNDIALDPLLLEFGALYQQIKKMEQGKNPEDTMIDGFFTSIIQGDHLSEDKKDYILHKNNRKVSISNASSGQQETLPLLRILRSLKSIDFGGKGATIYIEEPEAHIYPLAQKKLVELISYVFNSSKDSLQFVITTHSPYILSSLNNLMYAGLIAADENRKKAGEVQKIVQKSMLVNPSDVRAYSVSNGKAEDIIDVEMSTISQTALDSVSDEIAIEFDKLLEVTNRTQPARRGTQSI